MNRKHIGPLSTKINVGKSHRYLLGDADAKCIRGMCSREL